MFFAWALNVQSYHAWPEPAAPRQSAVRRASSSASLVAGPGRYPDELPSMGALPAFQRSVGDFLL